VNGAALSGVFLRGGGRLFFARLVGHEKSKLFLPLMVNVSLGRVGSRLTRSHRLTMMGNLFSRVSEVVGIMIAVIRSMLSGMRKGR
jgi:hypothetical protein